MYLKVQSQSSRMHEGLIQYQILSGDIETNPGPLSVTQNIVCCNNKVNSTKKNSSSFQSRQCGNVWVKCWHPMCRGNGIVSSIDLSIQAILVTVNRSTLNDNSLQYGPSCTGTIHVGDGKFKIFDSLRHGRDSYGLYQNPDVLFELKDSVLMTHLIYLKKKNDIDILIQSLGDIGKDVEYCIKFICCSTNFSNAGRQKFMRIMVNESGSNLASSIPSATQTAREFMSPPICDIKLCYSPSNSKKIAQTGHVIYKQSDVDPGNFH
ncbi:hypothetical protein pdam_00016235 [Pocillopora damicornis]|uniref:Uncharacterized protein n=1 Tax=Pocillopora damicornis TaxID=46731 RepID=A0A3M6UGW9_POCDA|nr:hypothetical protein pdam_00016235 [Pocillopora damicornis]